MKNVLCLLFLLLATAGFSLAQQHISVTLTPVTGIPCTFQATGVTAEMAYVLRPVLKPMTIKKNTEQCANFLIANMFWQGTNSRALTVTITFISQINPAVKLRKYTLTTAQVTEVLNDLDGPATGYTTDDTSVTITYGGITVDDLVLNTSYTCNLVTGTCI